MNVNKVSRFFSRNCHFEFFCEKIRGNEGSFALFSLNVNKISRFFFLKLLFSESPFLTTHWTQMLSLLGLQPFHNAVDVETMGTSSPDKWTIVSGTLAIRTTTVEGNPEKKAIF